MRGTVLFHLMAVLAAMAVPAATLADLRAIEDQWSVEIVTLGRKSGKPRPTTIWFVRDRGAIWVQSGQGGETSWYRNLLKNPRVTLRFDGLEIEARATPIDDPRETERVHGLFLDKYWTARISSWVGGGFGTGKVVRIEPLTSDPGGGSAAPDGAAASGASPPASRSE